MDDNLKEKITSLEKELLKPEVRADVEWLKGLIHDDFLEFSSSGNRYGKAFVLENLPKEEGTLAFQASKFEFRQLSEDVVQLIYESKVKSLSTGEMKEARRSSLWKLESEHWQMIFHQGTPKNEK